jgi:hypothetical protein
MIIWDTLNHDHVLPFIGVDTENCGQSIGLISPWMKHGRLCDYIRESHSSPRIISELVYVFL